MYGDVRSLRVTHQCLVKAEECPLNVAAATSQRERFGANERDSASRGTIVSRQGIKGIFETWLKAIAMRSQANLFLPQATCQWSNQSSLTNSPIWLRCKWRRQGRKFRKIHPRSPPATSFRLPHQLLCTHLQECSAKPMVWASLWL